jgi:hypothetical protein
LKEGGNPADEPRFQPERLDFCSLYVLHTVMKDHPASWRMPTPKQMDKMAADASRRAATEPRQTSADMPEEYRSAVLQDPVSRTRGSPIQQRRLAEIPRHVLRVSCRRCDRIVEIQTADAIRLYGQHAIWKDVGRRLLDDGCQQRTGRHEEDGCWPSFDTP